MAIAYESFMGRRKFWSSPVWSAYDPGVSSYILGLPNSPRRTGRIVREPYLNCYVS